MDCCLILDSLFYSIKTFPSAKRFVARQVKSSSFMVRMLPLRHRLHEHDEWYPATLCDSDTKLLTDNRLSKYSVRFEKACQPPLFISKRDERHSVFKLKQLKIDWINPMIRWQEKVNLISIEIELNFPPQFNSTVLIELKKMYRPLMSRYILLFGCGQEIYILSLGHR